MFTVQLSNDADVLDWRMRPGRVGEKRLIGKVIADRGDGEYERWVTWVIASDGSDVFDAFEGHYFQDEVAARADFHKRSL